MKQLLFAAGKGASQLAHASGMSRAPRPASRIFDLYRPWTEEISQ
jgi:hypothetical protein